MLQPEQLQDKTEVIGSAKEGPNHEPIVLGAVKQASQAAERVSELQPEDQVALNLQPREAEELPDEPALDEQHMGAGNTFEQSRGEILWTPGHCLKLGTEMGLSARPVRVPPGLPKMRHEGKLLDPEDFLEQLARVCRAHDVPPERYMTLVPLCLDSVDAKWVDAWISDHGPMLDWDTFCVEFKQHFQHPNAAVV